MALERRGDGERRPALRGSATPDGSADPGRMEARPGLAEEGRFVAISRPTSGVASRRQRLPFARMVGGPHAYGLKVDARTGEVREVH
jgi:hypothetical protein